MSDDDEPGPYVEPTEQACAVGVRCSTSNDEWFEVHYAPEGKMIRFCGRHALAAEALVTMAGWRGVDVPRVLQLLEGGRDGGDDEQACRACGGPRSEHTRSARCHGFISDDNASGSITARDPLEDVEPHG